MALQLHVVKKPRTCPSRAFKDTIAHIHASPEPFRLEATAAGLLHGAAAQAAAPSPAADITTVRVVTCGREHVWIRSDVVAKLMVMVAAQSVPPPRMHGSPAS